MTETLHNTWSGDFVSNALNIRPQNTTQFQAFRSFLGMALRKNPKRAHLLVSNLLGKHVPQKPSIINHAAAELAWQIQVHHVSPTVDSLILQLESAHMMQTVLKSHYSSLPLLHKLSTPITVFGYAETATNLGALVASHLKASYIHSTRYPISEYKDYGGFEESHSHASAHHITPETINILDEPERIIVLVDDELTTGNTVMNTIELFESHQHHNHYYVATLTDLRTRKAHKVFKQFAHNLGIQITVVSLLSMELNVPNDSVKKAQPLLNQLKQLPEPAKAKRKTTVYRHEVTNSGYKPLSQGVQNDDFWDLFHLVDEWKQKTSVYPDEKVLVLGIEEDMFLPFLLASSLETDGYDVNFSSTTRSPVLSADRDDYAIKDRIRYLLECDNVKRYAYNIGWDYDHIVIPVHSQIGHYSIEPLLRMLQGRTSTITVLTMTEGQSI